MAYRVLILRRVQRALAELPVRDYERVRDTINDLTQTPRPPGCLKLSGRNGWRIRMATTG